MFKAKKHPQLRQLTGKDVGVDVLARNQIHALFQNDNAVPHRIFYRYRWKAHLEGEKKLMLAILVDAVQCFLQETLTTGRDSQEAEEWIFEKNEEWPFSFESICETLGLNPMWARSRLLCEKKKKKEKKISTRLREINWPPDLPP